MKFYTVSNDYITYLKICDSKVPDNYDQARPFIGIVININDFDYIAPLSSPKPHLEKINNSKPSCFKLFNRTNDKEFLGVINLNYMIPYYEGEINLLDIDSITDEKYKGLIYKQFEYIKLNKEEIKKRANTLYDLVTVKQHNHFCSISCDFKKLEKHYLLFKDSTTETK